MLMRLIDRLLPILSSRVLNKKCLMCDLMFVGLCSRALSRRSSMLSRRASAASRVQSMMSIITKEMEEDEESQEEDAAENVMDCFPPMIHNR